MGLKSKLWIQDGGKTKINLKMIGAIVSISLVLIYFVTSLFANKTAKGISEQHEKARENVNSSNKSNQASTSKAMPTYIGPAPVDAPEVKRLVRIQKGAPVRFVYNGNQVIERYKDQNGGRHLKTSIKAIGKTKMAINSQDLGAVVEVVLPYGAKIKGEEVLPKGTVVNGALVTLDGSKRIFIQFTTAILPIGEMREIQGIALDAADFRPGVKAQGHSQNDLKLAGAIGLTMISSMSEVLTEKESLGDTTAISPKATMKNALYQGVADVAEMEGTRKSESLREAKDYLTLDEGSALIVQINSSGSKDL